MLFNGFVWDGNEVQILTRLTITSFQYIPQIIFGKYLVNNQWVLFDQYYRPLFFLVLNLIYSLFWTNSFFLPHYSVINSYY